MTKPPSAEELLRYSIAMASGVRYEVDANVMEVSPFGVAFFYRNGKCIHVANGWARIDLVDNESQFPSTLPLSSLPNYDELSVRARNGLRHAGLHDIDDVRRATLERFENTRHVGRLTAAEVNQWLSELRIYFSSKALGENVTCTKDM